MARHPLPRSSAPAGPTRPHRQPAQLLRRTGLVLIVLLVLTGTAVSGAAVPISGPGAVADAPHRSLPARASAGGRLLQPVGRWQWPLEPQPAVVRRFQLAPTPWGAGHRGVDLAARVGQPVLSAGAGTVSFSGVIAGQGVLAVTHPGGLRTTYEPVRARAARRNAGACGAADRRGRRHTGTLLAGGVSALGSAAPGRRLGRRREWLRADVPRPPAAGRRRPQPAGVAAADGAPGWFSLGRSVWRAAAGRPWCASGRSETR